MDKIIYDSIRDSLNRMKTAFGFAAQKYFNSLLVGITGNKDATVDITKLNEKYPQLHVYNHYGKFLVTGFSYDGTIYVDDGTTLWKNFEINGDIYEGSIVNTIEYLESLTKEIRNGKIVIRYDEEEKNFVPEYRALTSPTQIPEHLAMKKPFEYLGLHFIGAGTFKQNGIKDIWKEPQKILYLYEITPSGYNYEQFYETAKKHRQYRNDIFWCVEKKFFVVPGTNTFFRFLPETK